MLSVIIPVYNEFSTLPKLLNVLFLVPWPDGFVLEVIVVDDGSVDGTREWLIENEKTLGIKLFLHSKNKGKGAALRTGFNNASGSVVIVQDADLEYDPNEIIDVVTPIIKGNTKVCYGSRFLKQDQIIDSVDWVKKHRGSYFFAYIGGRTITHFCNFLFGSNLTDEPTCYKAFDKIFLDDIKLTSNGFELEPELTAKVLKRTTILEVPIHYYPRTYEEGKKVNWKDGVRALWKLLKHRIVD